MARRATARRYPTVDTESHIQAVKSDTSAVTGGRFTTLLENATQEILAVTYWFEPAPHPQPCPVTVRFTGRRVGVKGRVRAGDRFTQDETIEVVVPGSGPISLTARVRGINQGSWVVTASVLVSAHSARELREQVNTISDAGPLPPIVRLWRKWAPPAGSIEPVKTCLTPWAHVPGILPGIWGAMVTLGIAIALLLQFLVISIDHLSLGPWLTVSLLAIVVGIIGAKVWYIVLYRREHRLNGWCIQGFITGATLAAALMLVLLHVPAGTFLDVTAPGLLVAMGVGRVGCFFAGCCYGRPTASRWGVWSSDQRVGARRIPTQLLESALAGILGLGLLVAVLGHRPDGGAFFVATMVAYILGRQGILHLRAEPRKTRLGGLITAALAAFVLVAVLVLLAR